jgi:hypothetical protein
VWARILAIILFFAAFEGLLFHTDFYASIVEPESTTGYLELQIRNEIRRPKPNHNQVLAVGHSRMALLPRVVNEDQPGTGYTFASIALGGTAPRTWYYSLRAVDPQASNYAAIVIPSDDYNEPEKYDEQSERESDLHYLIARVLLRDLLDFPWTYRDKELQWEVVRGIILKGTIYKRDFLDFIDHPAARIAKARYYAHDSASWFYGYGGTEKNLVGLQIDWQRKTVTKFPPGLSPAERNQIEAELFPGSPPDRGLQTAYLRYWYGRIIDYYRHSATKLIFMEVPRAALSRPDSPFKRNSAVRQIAGQPNVVILDERLFRSLEHPDLFWSGYHMNRPGMEQFSRLLAAEVRRVLGPPK